MLHQFAQGYQYLESDLNLSLLSGRRDNFWLGLASHR